MIINAETCAVVKKIDPVADCYVYPHNYSFYCCSQSIMKTSGEMISLVFSYWHKEVRLFSYNQADETLTTVRNYGPRL